jgi:hypothetical protein
MSDDGSSGRSDDSPAGGDPSGSAGSGSPGSGSAGSGSDAAGSSGNDAGTSWGSAEQPSSYPPAPDQGGHPPVYPPPAYPPSGSDPTQYPPVYPPPYPSSGGQQPYPGQGYPPAPAYPYDYQQPQRFQNGQSVAALVLGICGFVTCGITGPLGIIFGALGIKAANEGRSNAKGMAIAGLVTGIITSLLLAFWVLSFMAGTSSDTSGF